MKTIHYILAALLGLFIVQTGMAQSDTIKIEGKNQKKVIILEEGEETKTVLKDSNSMIVLEMENTALNKKDSGGTMSYEFPSGKMKIRKTKTYSINFFSDFSFGYANAINNNPVQPANPYALPEMRDGLNFSMNFIKQEINLIKGQLYLATAFGINNYYYSLKNERTVPVEDLQSSISGQYVFGVDSFNNYKRNRVDTRFYSVPITLKWQEKGHDKKSRFAITAGVELNFNNRVISKLVIDEPGKELRSKIKLNNTLSGVIPSYIVRVQYGSVAAFARLVPDGVFTDQNHTGDVYSFGLATQF